MRIAVVGHVEHVTLGRVDAVPLAGDIAHLAEPRFLPGGGGGIAFAQLAKSDAELHLFTAIGEDDAGRRVRDRLARAAGRIHVHAALRAEPHPHVVVLVDAQGRRRVAVNLRLTEPGPIGQVPIRHFDGLDQWQDLPQDGRCVKDMWF